MAAPCFRSVLRTRYWVLRTRSSPFAYPARNLIGMFVTHLESALDGTRFAAGQVHTVHQGRPLWVRYDLSAVRAAVKPADLAARPPTLWRYRELLPLP